MRDLLPWLGFAVLLAFGLFALENLATTHVTFMGHGYDVRRIYLLFGVLALGFVLGKLIRIFPGGHH